MRFRATATWVTIISTGTLCLAVGAVRIPRRTQSAAVRSAAKSDSSPAAPSTIPMRTSTRANDERHSNTVVTPLRELSDSAANRNQIEDFPRVPGSGFGYPGPGPGPGTAAHSTDVALPNSPANNSTVARPWQNQAGYQEPEAWPFHRKTAEATSQLLPVESALSANGSPPLGNQTVTGNTTGPFRRDNFGTAAASTPDSTVNGFAVHASSSHATGSWPQSVPPTAVTNSLQNLPAPQATTAANARAPIQAAGYADRGGGVIHAFAESVTPRKYVTVGQWTEPRTRPVRSIQRVSFDAYPDYEDVQRVPAESLLNPYAARAGEYPHQTAPLPQDGQLVDLPAAYAPWWEEVINKPMRASPSTLSVNVESLILSAIEHSPQVTALRIDPIVRETHILEEAAAFDWQSFIESKYDDKNDPVGNSLTIGGNGNRFSDRNVTGRLGLEKRMAQGGHVDLSQKFGYQDNNSTFFTPTQQGTSRIELNFTQPLLRGAGQTYNESRTVLAMLDHQVSEDDLQDGLQDHLLEVYKTYWNLYRARAVRLQKERLLRRAIDVEQKLTARQGIDSVRRQVLRARAAIASRRSEIVRADMEVRNAESRLRLLVNSPDLKHSTMVELLPGEAPMSNYLSVSMRGSIETALENRPDIRRAIKHMKESAVRLEVSKNELLPKLDLVLGTYVAGLRGRGEVDAAWANQFRDGRPGYAVGLMLEYPLGNRAAKARYARREWEVARTLKEFEASVESSLTDVELAVRELETSYQEMLSRFQSMIAADTEATYLLERWRLMPGDDQTTSLLLENLLDSQQRVAMEEQQFVEAQVAYVLSAVRLKRASGILLSCDCNNSPVSFMTPALRQDAVSNQGSDSSQLAEPLPLTQPESSRPTLLEPSHSKLTPPLPTLSNGGTFSNSGPPVNRGGQSTSRHSR